MGGLPDEGICTQRVGVRVSSNLSRTYLEGSNRGGPCRVSLTRGVDQGSEARRVGSYGAGLRSKGSWTRGIAFVFRVIMTLFLDRRSGIHDRGARIDKAVPLPSERLGLAHQGLSLSCQRANFRRRGTSWELEGRNLEKWKSFFIFTKY